MKRDAVNRRLVAWLLASMFLALSSAAQDADHVRQTYSGAEVPDSLAFMSLLRNAALRPQEIVEPLTVPIMEYVAAQKMHYDSERAAAFVQALRDLHDVVDTDAESAVVESVCVPEATEWWPDTQALEALDRIGTIRESVYQAHYDSLLGSLSDRDRPLFESWLERSKDGMSFSRPLFAQSYADREDVAQEILVQFCRSTKDRLDMSSSRDSTQWGER